MLCTWALDTGKFEACGVDRAPGARPADPTAPRTVSLKTSSYTLHRGALTATGKQTWTQWGLVDQGVVPVDNKRIALQVGLNETAWAVVDTKGRSKAVIRPTTSSTPDRVAGGEGFVVAWNWNEVEVWKVGR